MENGTPDQLASGTQKGVTGNRKMLPVWYQKGANAGCIVGCENNRAKYGLKHAV